MFLDECVLIIIHHKNILGVVLSLNSQNTIYDPLHKKDDSFLISQIDIFDTVIDDVYCTRNIFSRIVAYEHSTASIYPCSGSLKAFQKGCGSLLRHTTNPKYDDSQVGAGARCENI